ncbi:MAG: T9SS type A sorting domain-containing protein [Paludibacter sp.]|nr:T9SS type A sorting domain-containing protein [Paludibacter sp.]
MRKTLLFVALSLLLNPLRFMATNLLMSGNANFETTWTGLTDYGSPNVILKKVTTIASDVPGWTGDVGNGNLSIYQGPGRTGNNSAVLINTHATGGARFYNDSVLKLQKGGKYRLTFYARGAATLVNVCLYQSGVRPTIAQVAGPNASGVYDPDKSTNTPVSFGSNWTKQEYNFTVPVNSAYTDYKLYLALYGCSAPVPDGSNLSSAFMIDDVQFEACEVPSTQDSLLAETAGISDLMLDSAILFRSSLRGEQGYRSGVYVYDSKSITTYLNNPEKLAARIALLGIKDVYVSATITALNGSNATRYQWLKDFNAAAHQYGLTTWAVRLANYDHFVSDALILQDCARVLSYNNSVSSNERFDAVSADWEPHVLKEGGADTPEELNIFWDSENNYGIGQENDSLLHRTHNMLSLAKNNLSGLMLNEAIHYMYQDRYDLGQLSYGSTVQFLNDCHYVTVMCYTNTKENVWQRADAPIDNASANPKKVSICVKTSMNTYGDGGDTSTSLYPKGWGYLISTMDYLYSQGAQKPAFRGVDFFEFEGLEKMWNNMAPPQSTRTAIEHPATENSACSVIYNRETGSLVLTNATRNYQMKIYSLHGKLISQQTTGQANEFSMHHLQKGSYIVSLSGESELPLIYKFIK